VHSQVILAFHLNLNQVYIKNQAKSAGLRLLKVHMRSKKTTINTRVINNQFRKYAVSRIFKKNKGKSQL